MKRIISLTASLLIAFFGFGFSDKPAESREAFISAQYAAAAELTAAASPAAIKEAETITAAETTVVSEPETASAPVTASETAAEVKTAENAAETESEKESYIWPADKDAIVIANYPAYSDGSAHWGVDIGLYNDNGCNVSEGTLIHAARDGEVVEAYNDGKWNTGFGNYCVIDHGNGVQTLYAHSKDIRVSEGDTVKQGQVIGIVGDTGNTTAPHLHFEVRVEKSDGSVKRVNPLKFISEP